MRSVVDVPVPGPRVGDFRATNRGGGLFSEAVSQPVGSVLAYAGARLGLAPTTLTMVNLACGVGASVALVLLAGDAAGGRVPGWVLGVVGLAGWQVAYAFDCADGQLARVTGRTSPAGARLDVLCDVAVQTGLVAALATVAVAYRPHTPVWLVAVFVGTWMVNLVTSVLQSGPSRASLVASRSLPVRLVKLVRDYGAVVFACGLVLLVAPQWTVGVLWAFTAVNATFLAASIAFAARASLR